MDYRFLTHGGREGIRDLGLLESALAVPCASFGNPFLHTTPFEMAAAYAYHIAENQPFIDGNEGAAITPALTFLKLNGIDLNHPREALYDAMIKLGARKMSKMQLAKLLSTLETKNRP